MCHRGSQFIAGPRMRFDRQGSRPQVMLLGVVEAQGRHRKRPSRRINVGEVSKRHSKGGLHALADLGKQRVRRIKTIPIESYVYLRPQLPKLRRLTFHGLDLSAQIKVLPSNGRESRSD